VVVLGLIHNIALLITLSVVHQLILRQWERHTIGHHVFSGLLYGSVAIAGMMTAVTVAPGVVFDGRSIVLAVAGFFGGPVTGILAAAMAIAYRVWLGSAGVTMGVLVIVTSAALGVALYYLRRRYPWLNRPLPLWLFGMLVHLVMLALTVTLPRDIGPDIRAAIAAPVLILYPIGFVLIARLMLDQEERIERDRTLRDSEARFRAIIEQTEQGISLAKQDGTVAVYNDAMEAISGYTLAEVREHGWFNLVYPDAVRRAEAVRLTTEALNGDLPYVEFPIVRKDGTERVVGFATKPVVLSGETWALSIMTDVTERRLAERRIVDLDEILARSPAVAFTWGNSEGWPLEFVSRGVTRFGYDAATLMREKFLHSRLIHPDDVERVTREIAAYLDADAINIELEYRILTPEGETRWVADQSWPVRGTDGTVNSLQGVLIDITARKTAEIELARHRDRLEEIVEERTRELRETNRLLEEANTAKTRFLANMSHELRTPMNSIIGFSGILVQGLAGNLNEEQHRQAAMINRSGKQLLTLINDILDVAKVEIGATEITRAPFDPAALLYEIAENMRPLAETKHLALNVACTYSGSEIISDAMKVRQILFNLTGNAISFTDSGAVTLTLEDSGDGSVTYSVADTGPGIPSEELERIFEPFVQLQQPGVAKSRGTGLGLPLCRQFATLIGGEVRVESEVGVGTTFILTLPPGSRF